MATSSRPSKIYVFGDQTFEYEQSLAQLLRSENLLLVQFFRNTFSALSTELGRLPLHLRDATPNFNSIADLLSRKRDGCISPALELVLCLIHCFAFFIWQHSEGQYNYPTPDDSQLLGLCVGALAAAAIGSSQNVVQLVPAAVHATVIALHTGLRAAQEAKSTSVNGISYASWSMIVLGVAESDMAVVLQRFDKKASGNPFTFSPVDHQQQHNSCKAYISAVSPGAVTVSGPPQLLAELSLETELAKADKAMLPIRSPYHAPHLFSQKNVDEILARSRSWSPVVQSPLPCLPFASCGTGHALWTVSPTSMLDSAVNDILTRTMLVTQALEHIGATVKAKSPASLVVVPVGTDVGRTVRRLLKTALAATTIAVELATMPRGLGECNSNRTTSAMGRSKIAVIGMSGRFPGAASADALWDLLQNKKDMCREVPGMRWDVKTHVDPTGRKKNTSKIRWGCWLDEPDLFDHTFFSISPREAPQVDPAQRLALMTAYEAIEDAGVVPGRTPSTREDRVGVFYGVTSNDWCEANSGQDLDAYYIPGANRAFIPGRINYCFKFSGPSYAIDTACSSSLAAIHIACNALWQGDIDMAIAGGTNVLTNPDMTAGLDKGHFLSETGNCKTFDESADGYCRGEGVATVVLKRLEDALEDGDPIQGLLLGAYTNHSAEAESITRPHVGAQKAVLERVLNDSGTEACEVGYVEMHGTGTQAGDTREMNSVCDVLSPVSPPLAPFRAGHQINNSNKSNISRRAADQPLHLGALKANIGHGESASGVSALIKVMMMMRRGTIPPHCGIKTRLNPAFPADLATARNVHIDLESTPWPRARGLPRKAIINNFSAAGGNTSLLVEEHAATDDTAAAAARTGLSELIRPNYPVAISAKSAKSLLANIQALLALLRLTIKSRSSADDRDGDHDREQPTIRLPQLSYTTTCRRIHHAYRTMVTCDSIEQLEARLAELQSSAGESVEESFKFKRAVPPRHMLFAFTGQGSQYPGMGRRLLETLAVFREGIHEFDQLVQRLGFPSIMPIFHAGSGGSGESSQNINDFAPVVVQLASACMQIVLARIWISWGVVPTAVVGHSLGEYAALNIAGVLSDADTVFLVGRRAVLLQEKCVPGSHAMLAVLAGVDGIHRAVSDRSSSGDRTLSNEDEGFEIACINGPKETVLAGSSARLVEIQQVLKTTGVKSTLLRVPYAFHSAQVTPILLEFENAAQRVQFNKPQIPVLSPLLGTVIVEAGVFGAGYLARHARLPVQMMKCLEAAMAGGILSPSQNTSYAVEFGPHPVVSNMIKETFQASGAVVTVLPTLRRNYDPWDVLAKSMSSLYTAGVPIKWDGYFADIPQARKVLKLPAYCWDLRSFWIPYRNDWTLTKGDIPPAQASTLASASRAAVPGLSVTPPPDNIVHAAPPKSIRLSTTIHRLLTDRTTSQGYDIAIESDVGRADLNPFIQGHKVDGFSLCTPAVYADISLSIGSYVLDRFHSIFPTSMVVAVANMDIRRALIGSVGFRQLLRCTANFSWIEKAAAVSFTVHDEHGNEIAQLAACQIRLVEASEGQRALQQQCKSLDTLQDHTTRMREAINSLRSSSTTCRLSGPMAYRLVSSLAEFDPDYHCIDEVLFDSEHYEAVCLVSFGQVKHHSDSGPLLFHTSPAAIDGLTQSAGFVMNANDRTKLDTSVFVNHGWKDLQLFEPIRDDCQYYTHVVMTEGEEQVWSGDISIFTEDRVVGVVKGVQIQGVPRRLLKFILTQASKPPKGTKSTHKPQEQRRRREHNSHGVSDAQLPTASREESTAHISATGLIKEQSKAALIARKIISEQSGVPIGDLGDNTRFEDIGVDSLLSLMITSMLAEELGIDADSNLFLESSTVADVLRVLETSLPGGAVVQQPHQADDMLPTRPVSAATIAAPGRLERSMPKPEYSAAPSVEALSVTESANEDTDGMQFAQVRNIIAEEVGVPLAQLSNDTSLADIGIDSLLSLMIGSRLRDELDLDLDTYDVLTSIGSIGSLREALFPGQQCQPSSLDKQPPQSSSSSSVASSLASNTPMTPRSTEDAAGLSRAPFDMGADTIKASSFPSSPAMVVSTCPPATSVILQGNPRTATRTLFLFPDGSGLASSYASLPRIHPNLVVYGLNSPYLSKKGGGLAMDCTWDQMIHSYLAEVRRRQPVGPYSFAGWSAGGILSYGAAQVLMEEGHEGADQATGQDVRDLIMLDSPAPENLKALPEHFFEYCSTAKLFGGQLGAAPAWLIAHFRAINNLLEPYYARPLAATKGLRKINILWACESSVDERFQSRPDDPEDMKFLTTKRTDFTPGPGWSRLFSEVPHVPIHVDRAVGQHHWNLLKGESAASVAAYIARVLE